jgi:serine/threonine-protein kinase
MTAASGPLTERYHLDSVLGTGGMATVWRGTDRVLSRTVAIKIANPSLLSDESFCQRFQNEARSAAKLTHPNIVAVYDTISSADCEAIIMECVEGETLRSVLDRETALSEERVRGIAVQLASALTEAHRNGVVHRDIKPANVLIDRGHTVKLADFGIAKAGSEVDATLVGSLVGTATYLSPEQVRGEPVDGRSDLYSLGILLFEMLTGGPPFRGDSHASTALARLHSVPRDVREFAPNTSPELAGIVARLLALDRADRFRTAAELEAALAAEPTLSSILPAETGAPASSPHISVNALKRQAKRSRAGASSAGKRPGRAKRRTGWIALVAVLVGTSALIYQLVTASAKAISPDTSVIQTKPTPLKIASVSAFDPEGSGTPGENDTLTAFAWDGDGATAWRTESYDLQNFGTKTGVGLVIELASAAKVNTVVIESPQTDWTGAIQIGSEFPTAAPVNATTFTASRSPESVTTSGRGRFVVVWITDLGPSSGRHRVDISELRVLGTTR